MSKSIPERIDAIVIVLERLAADVEIIREGLDQASLLLPKELINHRLLLTTQSSALERVSIGLGMVKHTAASLAEVRSHAVTIMEEVETLALVKNGLDMVFSREGQAEDWMPDMLERATNCFQHSLERIRNLAALLEGKVPELSKSEKE